MTTIGRAKLTTDHAQSNYGKPVLVLDDVAYGPEDIIDGHMAGSIIVTSDWLCCGDAPTPADLDLVRQWLSQSATHGKRWVSALDRI